MTRGTQARRYSLARGIKARRGATIGLAMQEPGSAAPNGYCRPALTFLMICQKNLPKLVPGINSGINGGDRNEINVGVRCRCNHCFGWVCLESGAFAGRWCHSNGGRQLYGYVQCLRGTVPQGQSARQGLSLRSLLAQARAVQVNRLLAGGTALWRTADLWPEDRISVRGPLPLRRFPKPVWQARLRRHRLPWF